MTLSTKDLLNGNDIGVRPTANSNPANTMRKYQQLALAAVSVISLVAFLFYKHEYDRLRYTLEYLEMFGSPPVEDGLTSPNCGSSTYRRLRTSPASWIKVSNDLVVYSAFWDEGNGYTNPVVRSLAIVKKSTEQHLELQALLRYEGSSMISTSDCYLEKIKERSHVTDSSSHFNDDRTIVYLICKPQNGNRKPPLTAQFQIGHQPPSSVLQIQESESWKSVANVTTVCAFTPSLTSTTRALIEFIAFYNAIGVEKFVFFGPVLTPLARKILDKYGDETGLYYEERPFNVPTEFSISDYQMRSLIEKDCIFRHRDTHEYILVLQLNQFLLPKNRGSIQDIVNYVSPLTSRMAMVSEFHFVTQRICVDGSHSKTSDLLLDSQVRVMSSKKENGLALIRPHLSTGLFRVKDAVKANEQHIPSSVAVVFSFETCSDHEPHGDEDHLPSYNRFVKKIRSSLLYRKWIINK